MADRALPAFEDIGFDVGTELLFEDHRVRVWSMALEPGAGSGFHRHQHDHFYVYVTGGNHLQTEYPDGTTSSAQYGDGYVATREIGDGTDPKLAHQLRNIGDTPHRQIVVEFLDGLARTEGGLSAIENERVS